MKHKYYFYFCYYNQNGVKIEDIICLPKVSIIKNRIVLIEKYGTNVVYFYKKVW